jgi:uncharacterized protein YfdQ (DUF2303 family)
MNDDDTRENIAETLARVLPKAELLPPGGADYDGEILRYAVPKGSEIKEIDTEKLLPNPRRTSATAAFADAESFLAYIKRHDRPGSTVIWCNFNPRESKLDFSAVFDDHAADGKAGWRAHKATFAPQTSIEWNAWKGQHKTTMPQLTFAEWLQEHDEDITSIDGFPTSLQMLELATNFVANEEHALKSAIKLQSGGVRLTYVADADKNTEAQMMLFDKFALGIPVFHGGEALLMKARLKYKQNSGKVSFHYELIRPDRVHEAASRKMVEKIRAGLGGVPMFMGQVA